MEDAPNAFRELLLKAKAGDEGAKTELYTLWYTPVFRFILSRVTDRESAEDLTQDTFMRLFESLPRFTETQAQPLSYLYTIARNATIDFHKKKKSTRLDDDEAAGIPDDDALSPEEHTSLRIDTESALEALAQLSPVDRDVISMRILGEYSVRDVAKHTGKSEDAVRQIQSRALRKLRTLLTS